MAISIEILTRTDRQTVAGTLTVTSTLNRAGNVLSSTGKLTRTDGTASAHASTLGGRYDFAFDAHDRLTAAQYSPGEGAPADEDFSTGYEYNDAGAPVALTRMGVISMEEDFDGATIETFGDMDRLDYAWNGVLLAYVDAQPLGWDFYGRTGFAGSASGNGADFAWDEAGQMTADSSRGITDIEYNWAGQPTRIVFGNNTELQYGYTCDGVLETMKAYRVVGGRLYPRPKSTRTYAGGFAAISPYSYCAANPIRYIDSDGKKPTAYEGALMAAAVYKDTKTYGSYIDELSTQKWVTSDYNPGIKMNQDNGLKSTLFEKVHKEGRKEFVYAFAGSETTTDWIQNAAQYIGCSSEVSSAIENATILYNKLKKDFGDNVELTFVGHSQGGMEASAASMATGNCAMTYNPATLSPATRLTNGLFNSGKIENFISASPKVLGQQYKVDCINGIQDPYGNALSGKTTLVEVSWFWSHSKMQILVKIGLTKSKIK